MNQPTIEGLAARVKRLERQNRILKSFGVVLCLFTVATVSIAAATVPEFFGAKSFSTGELSVVGYRNVVVLTQDGLILYNSKGAAVLAVRISKENPQTAYIEGYDPNLGEAKPLWRIPSE